MFPRGTPDISWADLAAGLVAGILPARADRRSRFPNRPTSWTGRPHLLCLSVRSALDLLLQELALPVGSEVIVSAVTIGDMLRILQLHGLVPVPIDICPETLGVDPHKVAAAVTGKTRLILVAHLFGSRMPMEAIGRIARDTGVLLVEDAAQALDGSAYRGHPDTDIALFSFGPIKTATASAGAVLVGRDPALVARLAMRQARYPRQPRRDTVRRLLRLAGLKVLTRRDCFGLFVAWCRWRGAEHDLVITQATRGFPADDLLRRLRHQPSVVLVQMIRRRLFQQHRARLGRRVNYAERIRRDLANPAPGNRATAHSHWVLPIFSRDPNGLIRLLWEHGFDATRRGSSLVAARHPERICTEAEQMLERLLYLPMCPSMPKADRRRMVRLVRAFETSSSPP